MTSRITRRALAALAAGGVSHTAVTAHAANAATPANSLPFADRMELLELIARYTWAYDCGDAEAFAATFVPDGAMIAWGKEVARGQPALQAFARARFAERGDKDWQHLTDHHVFIGNSARCHVYSYYSMLEGTRSEPRQFHVRSFGYYDSDCERGPGGWRFISRSIHRWNSNRLPWKDGAP
jgi:uncharacterized protein (TIGR02246 family)